MLVGGDICKALLKQEIRFRGLFPWTSLWFVVGWVFLFCSVLWLVFFPEGVKRFTRCFSGALEAFRGKIIEMLNVPVALQWHPVTVKQRLEQQAQWPGESLWWRGAGVGPCGVGYAGPCSQSTSPPRQACPGATVQPQPTPAPPAGPWVWYGLQKPAAWLASTGPALST